MKFRDKKPFTIRIGGVYYVDFKDPNMPEHSYKGRVEVRNIANGNSGSYYTRKGWYLCRPLDRSNNGTDFMSGESFKYEISYKT